MDLLKLLLADFLIVPIYHLDEEFQTLHARFAQDLGALMAVGTPVTLNSLAFVFSCSHNKPAAM